MEKSVEAKSWKAKRASASVTQFVSAKKNKKIFDNQLGG